MNITGRGARRATAAVLLLLVTMLLAACAASGGGETLGGGDAADEAGQPQAPGGSTDLSREAVGQDGDQAGGPAPAPGDGNAAPIEQRIVKTGEMTIEVAALRDAVADVRAMALRLGGYVGGSQAGTDDDGATLTLRIPAARFDDALDALREMGTTVLAEATREQDVTGQIVDLEARIENLRASEASYRELLARAERIDDVLAVQSRLDEVRGQIEQLEAQREVLAEQADLSTLVVRLEPRVRPVEQQAETWDPGRQASEALAALVGIGQGLASGLIWFVLVWLPILLVLTLLVLLALRGVLEVRRRMPGSIRADADEPAA